MRWHWRVVHRLVWFATAAVAYGGVVAREQAGQQQQDRVAGAATPHLLVTVSVAIAPGNRCRTGLQVLSIPRAPTGPRRSEPLYSALIALPLRKGVITPSKICQGLLRSLRNLLHVVVLQ